ncbi:MAG: hypothetical protein ACRDM1_07245 [Gaiellaceae bacterium]
MLDSVRQAAGSSAAGSEYVEFVTAGTTVVGEYHCSDCGYGVTVHAALPVCPMCAGTSWEQVSWSPLARAVGRRQ